MREIVKASRYSGRFVKSEHSDAYAPQKPKPTLKKYGINGKNWIVEYQT